MTYRNTAEPNRLVDRKKLLDAAAIIRPHLKKTVILMTSDRNIARSLGVLFQPMHQILSSTSQFVDELVKYIEEE